MLKESQRKLQFSLAKPITPTQWRTLFTLQLLDIYTSKKFITLPCVTESNPLFRDDPSVGDMILVKSVILIPTLSKIDLTQREGNLLHFLSVLVIANNIKVRKRAERACPRG
jgi:hypothetical protein